MTEYDADWRSKKCRGIVYKIYCKEENKSYVGITRRSLKQRMQQHKKQLSKATSTEGSLQEALMKYGLECMTISVLDTARTLGELADKEVQYIAKYNTLRPLGYNANRGGAVARGIEQFEFDGEIYWGLADLADAYGIYEETLRKRVSAGWTLRQAVELDEQPERIREGRNWEVDGTIYPSTSNLCRNFRILNRTFLARLERGWTLKQSLGLEEPPVEAVRYNDVDYGSLSELAKELDLNYGSLISRLASGLSLKEAIENPVNPSRYGRQRVTIDGMDFESWSKAAEYFELSSEALKRRLEVIDDDEATFKYVGLPQKKYVKRNRILEVEGKVYHSFKDLEKKYGVNHNTIRQRLNKGKTIEEAVGLIKIESSIFPLKFEGAQFNNQKELADAYNLNQSTLSYRLRQGYSLREAVGLDEKLNENTKIIIGEIEYNSESAAAEAYGINQMNYFSRRERGWSIEEALEVKPRKTQRNDRKLYVVIDPEGGQEFVSNVTEFCRNKGWKSETNLFLTLNHDKHHSYHGYSLRNPTDVELEQFISDNPEALVSRVGYKRNHPLTYKGVTYDSKLSFCRAFELAPTTFTRALARHGGVEAAMIALGKND